MEATLRLFHLLHVPLHQLREIIEKSNDASGAFMLLLCVTRFILAGDLLRIVIRGQNVYG
jgi:hypothetical protein